MAQPLCSLQNRRIDEVEVVSTAKIVIWNAGEFAQPLLATPSGKYRFKQKILLIFCSISRQQVILKKNYTFAFILSALVVLFSIISIGDFRVRLAAFDWSTSGPFSVLLIQEPEIFAGDLAETLRPLGFIKMGPLIQWGGTFLGVPAPVSSYLLVVIANVIMVLSLWRLGRVMGWPPAIAAFCAVVAFVSTAERWSLPVMGMVRTYPHSGAIAMALVPAVFADVLEKRWRRCSVLLFLIAIFHIGYGTLTAMVLGVVHLLQLRQGEKMGAISLRMVGLFPVGILALGILIFLGRPVHEAISPKDLSEVLYAIPGHAIFWRNPGFPAALSNFLAIIVASLWLARWPKPGTIGARLTMAVAAVAVAMTLVQLLGLSLKIELLATFNNSWPARITGYLPLLLCVPVAGFLFERIKNKNHAIASSILLAWMVVFQAAGLWIVLLWLLWGERRPRGFPGWMVGLAVFGGGLLLSLMIGLYEDQLYGSLRGYLLGTFLPFSKKRVWVFVICVALLAAKNLFGLMPVERRVLAALVLAAGFFAAGRGAETHKNQSFSAYELELWMNAETPRKAVFLVPEVTFQQNAIARRKTVYLLPGLLSAYSTNDRRTIEFDKKIFAYFDLPRGDTPGWFKDYYPALFRRYLTLDDAGANALGKAFGADYLVTYTSAANLGLHKVYENRHYAVYELRKTGESGGGGAD